MKKRLGALLLSVCMLLSTAGCASAPSSQPAETASAPSSQPAESAPASSSAPAEESQEAAFPVTVTDAAGREVTISAQPQKVVSGYYITTSMVIALGAEDRLVGIEAKADTRPIYSLAAPELLELPSVGTAKEFDLEGCAALEPDLVILPLKLKDTVPALEELGIPVITVNPEDLSLLEETIGLLGKALGANEEAQTLLDYNHQTQEELSALLKDAGQPTVYLAGNSSYLSTAGAKMYQNTLIQQSGGVNVAAQLEDDYWAEISYEQLLAWNPQVIIIVPEASYTREDLLADPQLAGLDAVKNGRVYAMPTAFEAWDSPVPSAMVGSRWLASVLHEDLYPFEEFQQDAAAFYQTFYGVEIDQSLLTR